jgi:hypothetical protein
MYMIRIVVPFLKKDPVIRCDAFEDLLVLLSRSNNVLICT